MKKYMFLIYHRKQFYGYTDSKKMLRKFLNTRRGDYEIRKIHKEDLPENLLEYEYEGSELVYFIDEFYMNKVPVREFEVDMFAKEIEEMLVSLKESAKRLSKANITLEQPKCDEMLIDIFLRRLNTFLSNIEDTEISYGKYVNVKKFMKHCNL